ncbi:MAG: UvrB/UvrC motif-containing protein [Patescibacteria group bacterium]
MQRSDLSKFQLPDVPGVYLFKQGRKVLYVGKATSLRDRVRSYFDDDLIATRGPRIVDMVTQAKGMIYHTTPTVLEALVKEAALIKKYMPPANSDGKDDKTFLYAVITDEEIPRVLAIRGKDIDFENKTAFLPPASCKLLSIFGPFPSGPQLREGLRLIRKIFPFFDTPRPVGQKSKHQQARIEFNTQIEQYPRDMRFTLTSSIGENKVNLKRYRRTIKRVALFLGGKTKELRHMLEREMKSAAAEERFEDAAEARRQLFALDHIQDVSLIKDENRYQQYVSIETKLGYRIEAYDTAHLAGTNAIGVMVVVEDGVPVKREYRTFRIRGVKKNDDVGSLKEILIRRFNHPEWPFPAAIVVDGGAPQKRAAESVIAAAGLSIGVAAVVKDERHRPREVLGARRAGVSEADAVLANAEAHRFSLSRHRAARSRNIRSK